MDFVICKARLSLVFNPLVLGELGNLRTQSYAASAITSSPTRTSVLCVDVERLACIIFSKHPEWTGHTAPVVPQQQTPSPASRLYLDSLMPPYES